MEAKLVQQWDRNNKLLRSRFEAQKPDSYDDIFKQLFEVVLTDEKYQTDKITVIDDGDYQGTRIFVIPKNTYQPSGYDYLVCEVDYGSCSGCDTYEAICSEYYEDKLTESQVNQFMTLALHMLQSTKPLFDNH